MEEYYGVSPHADFFMHYGIKGMKWGVRRLQKYRFGNPAERKRYDNGLEKHFNKAKARLNRLTEEGKTSKAKRMSEAMANVFRNTDYDRFENDKTRALSKQMDQIESDFYKSKDHDQIIRKLAKQAAKKYAKGTKDDVKRYYYGYKYDDLDNGESFRIFINQNKKAGAAYKKLETDYWNEKTKLHKKPAY